MLTWGRRTIGIGRAMMQRWIAETVRRMPSFVDHVIVVGPKRTDTSLVEKELRLHAGDPLSREAVLDQARRLIAVHGRGLPLDTIHASLALSGVRGRDSLSIITDVEIAFAWGAVPPTLYRGGRRVA